jgi:hypothetical protein
MSNGFQGNQQRGGAGGAPGATQFFGQMMMMPFSTFVYGMQILVQMLQGMQQMTGQGVGAAGDTAGAFGARGGFPGGGGAQATGGANAYSAGTSRRTTREEDRAMSDQNWSGGGRDQQGGGAGGQGFGGQGWGSGGRQGSGGQGFGGGQQGCGTGDQGWTVSEECRDAEPCDQLRLIRYKVLFLKRDLEVAFPEQEELITEDMPKDGFISWKVAEFIQSMGRGEVAQPGRWKEKGYPSSAAGGKVENGKVTALPDKDKRFLRVYCQVLECYDRERMNYERDQIDVLKEIRDAIKSGL